jgi:hypothetical protein
MDGYKPFDRAVICALNFGWKETGRQFIGIPMIVYTFTAYPFTRAGLIRTIAFSLIAIHLTFPHTSFPTWPNQGA